MAFGWIGSTMALIPTRDDQRRLAGMAIGPVLCPALFSHLLMTPARAGPTCPSVNAPEGGSPFLLCYRTRSFETSKNEASTVIDYAA
jgi:hypothetical protein